MCVTGDGAVCCSRTAPPQAVTRANGNRGLLRARCSCRVTVIQSRERTASLCFISSRSQINSCLRQTGYRARVRAVLLAAQPLPLCDTGASAAASRACFPRPSRPAASSAALRFKSAHQCTLQSVVCTRPVSPTQTISRKHSRLEHASFPPVPFVYLVPFDLVNGLIAEIDSSAGFADASKHPPVVLQLSKTTAARSAASFSPHRLKLWTPTPKPPW